MLDSHEYHSALQMEQTYKNSERNVWKLKEISQAEDHSDYGMTSNKVIISLAKLKIHKVLVQGSLFKNKAH